MHTLAFIDCGNFGQVAELWEWKLRYDYQLTEEWGCEYYGVRLKPDGWYIVAHPGCVWDYATGYFDGDYIKEASLGHDVLHWLIGKCIISPRFNDAIDQEFYEILIERGNIAKWRAAILQKAVGLVDQKPCQPIKKVSYLRKGKRLKDTP